MSSGTDSNDTRPEEIRDDLTGPMRELREYARGNLDVDHRDISHISGLVDSEEILELLLFAEAEYDPEPGMPPSFWKTQFAQEILKRHASRRATRAINNGNRSVAAYLSGTPSYDSDVSGLQAINTLSRWLIESEQCKLIYAAALMGRGKTDFALLLLEIIQDHYRRIRSTVGSDHEIPRPEFATNFRARPPEGSETTVREIHRFSELLERGERGSSDDVRWFVFDEASSELTAQSGANAQEVAEVFAPFVKKMRKMGINMIVIGHDRRDVHPAIRSVASFVDKTGTKTAEIYEGIKQREPYGHKLSISGIPPTSWRFDTDDVASWEWDARLEDLEGAEDGSELEDRDDLIARDEWLSWRDQRIASIYYGTDLSQRDVAEAFDVSQSTISEACSSVSPEQIESVPAEPRAGAD
jgi:predicted XRE-type DNA-binding protein